MSHGVYNEVQQPRPPSKKLNIFDIVHPKKNKRPEPGGHSNSRLFGIISMTRLVIMSEFWFLIQSGMKLSSNNDMQKLTKFMFFRDLAHLPPTCRTFFIDFKKIFLTPPSPDFSHSTFQPFSIVKKFKKVKMIKSLSLTERILKKPFPKSDVLTFQNCNFSDSLKTT